jgi:hypothetical protein
VSEWIKCSDRLPGTGMVLAYAPGNDDNHRGPVSVETANSLLWWHQNYPERFYTHWMPFPEPPASSHSAADAPK